MSSVTCRTWNAGVWDTAPSVSTPEGWWPHVQLAADSNGAVSAALVGSQDPRTVQGAQTLEDDWLVRVPVIPGEGLGETHPDPHQVFVYWGVFSRISNLANPAVNALVVLNRDLGIRWLYQHSWDPRRMGIIGSAAVYPDTHAFPMDTETGTRSTPPVDDRLVVIAGLRAALAYTLDTDAAAERLRPTG